MLKCATVVEKMWIQLLIKRCIIVLYAGETGDNLDVIIFLVASYP